MIMRIRYSWSTLRDAAASLMAVVAFAGTAWGQQSSSASSANDQSKNGGVVKRTFGSEGGYRTEMSSQTKGYKLTEEDGRQLSLLAAQVFQHIDAARDSLDADDTKTAQKEVNKAREAIKAIRTMLPTTMVRMRTVGPDGKAIYEDEREVQPSRIPLYEAILHAQTLAPILAARRHAKELAGMTVVESETVATEVIADLDPIEGQLVRAAKALEKDKPDDASKALAMALVRGLDVRFNKEDSELASARDAIWMAKRSLEENNSTQALVNLAVAKQRLQAYRLLLSQDQRQEVDQMLREVEQLEGQLRQEGTRTVGGGERATQSSTVGHWWDRINRWFRRHF
jgi:hypothetical protein